MVGFLMRFYISHLHTSCAIKQFGTCDCSYKEFEAKKKFLSAVQEWSMGFNWYYLHGRRF